MSTVVLVLVILDRTGGVSQTGDIVTILGRTRVDDFGSLISTNLLFLFSKSCAKSLKKGPSHVSCAHALEIIGIDLGDMLEGGILLEPFRDRSGLGERVARASCDLLGVRSTRVVRRCRAQVFVLGIVKLENLIHLISPL